MVDDQLRRRGIKNPDVLKAMATVKREFFVPEEFRSSAYEDHPLSIGFGQTISQPYIVAAMTELISPKKTDVVLEVGTGSGYQAAVLAHLVDHVYTIEIVRELADQSRSRLKDLGYKNVSVKAGNGFHGWPEHGPYDAIVVTAAPKEVPVALLEQLKNGGKLVIPVGTQEKWQILKLLWKDETGAIYEKSVMPVRFVPFTGTSD